MNYIQLSIFSIASAAVVVLFGIGIDTIIGGLDDMLVPCQHGTKYINGKCSCLGTPFTGKYCGQCNCSYGTCMLGGTTPRITSDYGCRCPFNTKRFGLLCNQCYAEGEDCSGKCLRDFYGAKCERTCYPDLVRVEDDATCVSLRSNGGQCNICSGHGVCNNGDCECDEGWYNGDRAQCSRTCKGGCLHGVCKLFNNIPGCLCEEGWKGTNCDIKCNCVHGNCILNFEEKTATCECNQKWRGPDCSIECPGDVIACSGHGVCNSTGQCICDVSSAWQGPSCNCSSAFSCSGHGVCEGDKCICSGNFAGENCNRCKKHHWGSQCQLFCNPATTCHGNGKCVVYNSGVERVDCACGKSVTIYDGEARNTYKATYAPGCAQCEAGYLPLVETAITEPGIHIECQILCKASSCNFQGACNDEYGGGQPLCKCNGNRNDSSFCTTCNTGWYPADIQNEEACSVYCDKSLNCSDNGVCGPNGQCLCDEGFTGDSCQIHCVGSDNKTCSGHGQCLASPMQRLMQYDTQSILYSCVCDPQDPYTPGERREFIENNETGALDPPPIKEYFGDTCQAYCLKPPWLNAEVCNGLGKCEAVPIESPDGRTFQCQQDTDCNENKEIARIISADWGSHKGPFCFKEKPCEEYTDMCLDILTLQRPPATRSKACMVGECMAAMDSMNWDGWCTDILEATGCKSYCPAQVISPKCVEYYYMATEDTSDHLDYCYELSKKDYPFEITLEYRWKEHAGLHDKVAEEFSRFTGSMNSKEYCANRKKKFQDVSNLLENKRFLCNGLFATSPECSTDLVDMGDAYQPFAVQCGDTMTTYQFLPDAIRARGKGCTVLEIENRSSFMTNSFDVITAVNLIDETCANALSMFPKCDVNFMKFCHENNPIITILDYLPRVGQVVDFHVKASHPYHTSSSLIAKYFDQIVFRFFLHQGQMQLNEVITPEACPVTDLGCHDAFGYTVGEWTYVRISINWSMRQVTLVRGENRRTVPFIDSDFMHGVTSLEYDETYRDVAYMKNIPSPCAEADYQALCKDVILNVKWPMLVEPQGDIVKTCGEHYEHEKFPQYVEGIELLDWESYCAFADAFQEGRYNCSVTHYELEDYNLCRQYMDDDCTLQTLTTDWNAKCQEVENIYIPDEISSKCSRECYEPLRQYGDCDLRKEMFSTNTELRNQTCVDLQYCLQESRGENMGVCSGVECACDKNEGLTGESCELHCQMASDNTPCGEGSGIGRCVPTAKEQAMIDNGREEDGHIIAYEKRMVQLEGECQCFLSEGVDNCDQECVSCDNSTYDGYSRAACDKGKALCQCLPPYTKVVTEHHTSWKGVNYTTVMHTYGGPDVMRIRMMQGREAFIKYLVPEATNWEVYYAKFRDTPSDFTCGIRKCDFHDFQLLGDLESTSFMYNYDCSKECPGTKDYLPCAGHGRCTVQGTCACDIAKVIKGTDNTGSTFLLNIRDGETLSTSRSPISSLDKTGYRGSDCSITCPGYDPEIGDMNTICSGHGICNIDGDCQCDYGYIGDECQFKCPVFEDNICTGHGTCEMTDIEFERDLYDGFKTTGLHADFQACKAYAMINDLELVNIANLQVVENEFCAPVTQEQCEAWTKYQDITYGFHTEQNSLNPFGCHIMQNKVYYNTNTNNRDICTHCVCEGDMPDTTYCSLDEKLIVHTKGGSEFTRKRGLYNSLTSVKYTTFEEAKDACNDCLAIQESPPGSGDYYIVHTSTNVRQGFNTGYVEVNTTCSEQEVLGTIPTELSGSTQICYGMCRVSNCTHFRTVGTECQSCSPGGTYELEVLISGEKYTNYVRNPAALRVKKPTDAMAMVPIIKYINKHNCSEGYYDYKLEKCALDAMMNIEYVQDAGTEYQQVFTLDCQIKNGTLQCAQCSCFKDFIYGHWSGVGCSTCDIGYGTDQCTRVCPDYDGETMTSMCNGYGQCLYGSEKNITRVFQEANCVCGRDNVFQRRFERSVALPDPYNYYQDHQWYSAITDGKTYDEYDAKEECDKHNDVSLISLDKFCFGYFKRTTEVGVSYEIHMGNIGTEFTKYAKYFKKQLKPPGSALFELEKRDLLVKIASDTTITCKDELEIIDSGIDTCHHFDSASCDKCQEGWTGYNCRVKCQNCLLGGECSGRPDNDIFAKCECPAGGGLWEHQCCPAGFRVARLAEWQAYTYAEVRNIKLHQLYDPYTNNEFDSAYHCKKCPGVTASDWMQPVAAFKVCSGRSRGNCIIDNERLVCDCKVNQATGLPWKGRACSCDDSIPTPYSNIAGETTNYGCTIASGGSAICPEPRPTGSKSFYWYPELLYQFENPRTSYVPEYFTKIRLASDQKWNGSIAFEIMVTARTKCDDETPCHTGEGPCYGDDTRCAGDLKCNVGNNIDGYDRSKMYNSFGYCYDTSTALIGCDPIPTFKTLNGKKYHYNYKYWDGTTFKEARENYYVPMTRDADNNLVIHKQDFPCPKGKYGVRWNNIRECALCPPGKYQSNTGQSDCITDGKCNTTNLWGVIDVDLCNGCPLGTDYYNAECNPCNTGKYHDGTKCTQCLINTYQSLTGQINCTNCPAGRDTNDDTQGKSITDCHSCANGRYNDISGERCKDCAKGKYAHDMIGLYPFVHSTGGNGDSGILIDLCRFWADDLVITAIKGTALDKNALLDPNTPTENLPSLGLQINILDENYNLGDTRPTGCSRDKPGLYYVASSGYYDDKMDIDNCKAYAVINNINYKGEVFWGDVPYGCIVLGDGKGYGEAWWQTNLVHRNYPCGQREHPSIGKYYNCVRRARWYFNQDTNNGVRYPCTNEFPCLKHAKSGPWGDPLENRMVAHVEKESSPSTLEDCKYECDEYLFLSFYNEGTQSCKCSNSQDVETTTDHVRYSRDDGDKLSCKDCSPGSYQNELGKSVCKLCTAGKYHDQYGQTSNDVCKNCDLGKYSHKGWSECTTCPAGYYQNEHGQATCIGCPVGYYQTEEGQTTNTCKFIRCSYCLASGWPCARSDRISEVYAWDNNYIRRHTGTLGLIIAVFNYHTYDECLDKCLNEPNCRYIQVEEATSYRRCYLYKAGHESGYANTGQWQAFEVTC